MLFRSIHIGKDNSVAQNCGREKRIYRAALSVCGGEYSVEVVAAGSIEGQRLTIISKRPRVVALAAAKSQGSSRAPRAMHTWKLRVEAANLIRRDSPTHVASWQRLVAKQLRLHESPLGGL